MDLCIVEPQVAATIAALKHLRNQAGPYLGQLDDQLIKLATDFGLKVADSMRHEFQISIREKYIDNLINNLTERFADSDLLSALITLFHSNKAASSIESVGLEEYGNGSVRVIATHFSTTVDSERLQLEWMRFKHIVLNQFSETPAHDVMAVISSDSSFLLCIPTFPK